MLITESRKNKRFRQKWRKGSKENDATPNKKPNRSIIIERLGFLLGVASCVISERIFILEFSTQLID